MKLRLYRILQLVNGVDIVRAPVLMIRTLCVVCIELLSCRNQLALLPSCILSGSVGHLLLDDLGVRRVL